MIKRNIKLSLVLGVALANGVFASNHKKDREVFDVNSIEYVEEEIEVVLNFDVADYLPEDFDPYKMYVNLDAIEFVEEELESSSLEKHLPINFNPYAYPQDAQSINYIDEDDEIQLNFAVKEYLPEGFNPYKK